MFNALLTYSVCIRKPSDLDLLKAINYELKDVPFHDVQNWYYVMNWPEVDKYAFLTRDGYNELFERLADGPALLTNLIKKK